MSWYCGRITRSSALRPFGHQPPCGDVVEDCPVEGCAVGADILVSGALAPDAASLPVGSSLRLYFLTEHVLTVGLSEHEFIV